MKKLTIQITCNNIEQTKLDIVNALTTAQEVLYQNDLTNQVITINMLTNAVVDTNLDDLLGSKINDKLAIKRLNEAICLLSQDNPARFSANFSKVIETLSLLRDSFSFDTDPVDANVSHNELPNTFEILHGS